MFFLSPKSQWEKVLSQPLAKQVKFLNKVCKINKRDALEIREVFFEKLDYPLVRKIVKLVNDVVEAGEFDPSFVPLIYDRLLRVIDVEDLYPEEYQDDDDNVIFGEGYHVYSAGYKDLDLLVDFVNSHKDIKSLCDLGSGSGRALLYLALQIEQKMNYLGLELVDERVVFTNAIADHFQLENVSFKTSNFLETPTDFHGYDSYYLYDPVGTTQVPTLIAHFKELIASGAKFYILFISGWDEIMLTALDEMDDLEKLSTTNSRKQEGRVVNFYKVK